MYDVIFGQFKKQLGQLDKWLDAAEAHAKATKFDTANYLSMRLAPDQFPFSRQVLLVCDTARLGAARLTGKDLPAASEDGATLDDMRARVRAAIAYLDGLTSKDFADAAARSVTQPRWEGKTMSGADYFVEHALPNFYFHLSHVYALLRHNGVNLGKRDYLGTLSMRAPG